MLFLHKGDNFVPYTPRRKENLHENLRGHGAAELVEGLELVIRKEVHPLPCDCMGFRYNCVTCYCPSPSSALTLSLSLSLSLALQLHDFARLRERVFYVYSDIEFFKDEPQKVDIACEEDIHVTEEVYKRPVFTAPLYRFGGRSRRRPF